MRKYVTAELPYSVTLFLPADSEAGISGGTSWLSARQSAELPDPSCSGGVGEGRLSSLRDLKRP